MHRKGTDDKFSICLRLNLSYRIVSCSSYQSTNFQIRMQDFVYVGSLRDKNAVFRVYLKISQASANLQNMFSS